MGRFVAKEEKVIDFLVFSSVVGCIARRIRFLVQCPLKFSWMFENYPKISRINFHAKNHINFQSVFLVFSNPFSIYFLWLIGKLRKAPFDVWKYSIPKLIFEGHVFNRFIQGLFARVLHYNFVPPCVVGFLMAFTVTLCYGLYSCFEIRTLLPINTRENLIVALVNGNI